MVATVHAIAAPNPANRIVVDDIDSVSAGVECVSPQYAVAAIDSCTSMRVKHALQGRLL